MSQHLYRLFQEDPIIADPNAVPKMIVGTIDYWFELDPASGAMSPIGHQPKINELNKKFHEEGIREALRTANEKALAEEKALNAIAAHAGRIGEG